LSPVTAATLKRTLAAYNEDKASRLATAIAYATIFSLAPLLIILIAVVGGILGATGAHGHTRAEDLLFGQIRATAGNSAAETVRQLVAASFDKPRQGVVAQVFGWIAFIFGASGLFAALQDGLNAVWHIEAVKGGWRQVLRDRLASVAMIAIVGLLILASFVINAGISIVGAHLASRVPGSPWLFAAIYQIVTVMVATAIFTVLFKVLPDVKLRWNDVWLGGLVTGVLFVVGEALISLYLAFAGVASAYGAAGSLLVALLWIYYSAMILLLGAEFTKVHAGRATTTVAAAIRQVTDAPSGVDPRTVAGFSGSTPNGDAAQTKPVAADCASLARDISETRARLGDLFEALAFKLDVPARTKDQLVHGLESTKEVAVTTAAVAGEMLGKLTEAAGTTARATLSDVRNAAAKMITSGEQLAGSPDGADRTATEAPFVRRADSGTG
jgi:membrane protein